ncbi:MAG TPA: hypothetical protein VF792_10085 [Ktedonobacterales bacterium]
MRLVNLCTLNLRPTTTNALVRPFGTEEGTTFQEGEGVAEGERLRGVARWCNVPRRRSDGAMLPDIRGVIHTHEGAMVIFHLEGRVIWNPTNNGPIGDQLMRVTFVAEDARYQWLNNAFCVFEGRVRPPSPTSDNRPQRVGDAYVYECVNDLS